MTELITVLLLLLYCTLETFDKIKCSDLTCVQKTTEASIV